MGSGLVWSRCCRQMWGLVVTGGHRNDGAKLEQVLGDIRVPATVAAGHAPAQTRS